MLEVENVPDRRRSTGRLFQARGPATARARSPMVERRALVTRTGLANFGLLYGPCTVGCSNSPALACHCMTASWLAAVTQTTARELDVPPLDFTPDARPAAILPIYAAHNMMDCTLGLGCNSGVWLRVQQ